MNPRTPLHRAIAYACVLAALATAAPCVHAVVIAYEGFDYPAGPIAGLDGGTGWTGAWVNDSAGAPPTSSRSA